MERQHISKIVFDSIKDKSRLEGFKKVAKIENFEHHAVVTAADGSSFQCQVVAGADGTHSMVRKLIRQEAPPTPPPSNCKFFKLCVGIVLFDTDHTTDLASNTYCIFGISTPVAQIGEGRHFAIYQPRASALVFSGLHGKLYWFMFKELETPLEYGTRRRFDDKDVEAAYALVSHTKVTEGVKFSDIYKHTEYRIILPIEQGICETWHAKRMFLLGDAAHKVR